jgi:hypothetical protein
LDSGSLIWASMFKQSCFYRQKSIDIAAGDREQN